MCKNRPEVKGSFFWLTTHNYVTEVCPIAGDAERQQVTTRMQNVGVALYRTSQSAKTDTWL